MKQKEILIAPSILSADFARLGEEIADVEKAGCDVIHVDVMDGHFVPNLTIGPVVVKWVRKITKLPLDVHLMIDDPIRYVDDFAKAGADWITFHVEATDQVGETLKKIKAHKLKGGLSLRPKTKIETLTPYLELLDLVLIMTVEPGFGGQSFMPEMMPKIKALREQSFQGLISVDGGINRETAPLTLESGADLLVAGTAVFGNPNRTEAIQQLRNNR